MASGSDGKGRHGPPGGGRRAELEAERDALQEKIDELRDEIDFFEKGISETSYDETVDTAIAKRQARARQARSQAATRSRRKSTPL